MSVSTPLLPVFPLRPAAKRLKARHIQSGSFSSICGELSTTFSIFAKTPTTRNCIGLTTTGRKRLRRRPQRRGMTSVREFQKDRDAFVKLAKDPKVDLAAKIPHGQGQTYLREIILAADHAAYHIGELVLVRKLLGIWK